MNTQFTETAKVSLKRVYAKPCIEQVNLVAEDTMLNVYCQSSENDSAQNLAGVCGEYVENCSNSA